ncbi:MAG: nucleotide-binding protein, partial [Methanomicrobiales archaeon]|nr:nucleotide-binding protein [Methanomicrobiales archaeon]
MTLILDASVFFSEIPVEEPAYTTPSVVTELADFHARCRFEALVAAGLSVREPRKEDLLRVDTAALRTGDTGVLSGTDRDILALALELQATLVTDDFAIQNVAHRLGIETRSIRQRQA